MCAFKILISIMIRGCNLAAYESHFHAIYSLSLKIST